MTKNKVALITGSSRGIGAATAKLLAAQGYAIVVNYLTNKDAAELVKSEITKLGVDCVAVQADVSDEQQVSRLFAAADELGELKILVNNTGVLEQQTRFEDISLARLQRVLNANVVSCFLCCQQSIKRMSTRHGGSGGNIVNVSSGAAKTGSPNEYVDYAASKGAMDTLTRGIAMEVAEERIRVNAVRPGLIYTDMHASGGEPERVDRLKSKIPLARGGQADEVAEAIVWLATDKSSFVTGSFIDATGGL